MEQKEKIVAAKRLFNDEGIMSLLGDYLLGVEDTIKLEEVGKMSDEQIGQITRANMLAEHKVKQRFASMKNLTLQGEKQEAKTVKS